jgi:ADP-ribose pyrophosphatase YjhB (NUDIX family)
VIHRLLLWIWRVLPLTANQQWPLLWIMNVKFLAGVMAVVFDDQGRVLLLHHTYRNSYPWGLPGGWLGPGESPAEGALRELREETGFAGTIESLVWVGGGHPRREIGIGYLVRVEGGSFRANDEIDRCAYFEMSSLPDGLLPFQRDVIAEAARVRAKALGAATATDP